VDQVKDSWLGEDRAEGHLRARGPKVVTDRGKNYRCAGGLGAQ
jgi:hypothetical protein